MGHLDVGQVTYEGRDMEYEWAEGLSKGVHVRRSAWPIGDTIVEIFSGEIGYHPNKGQWYPWRMTMRDALATDWETTRSIIEPQKPIRYFTRFERLVAK